MSMHESSALEKVKELQGLVLAQRALVGELCNFESI